MSVCRLGKLACPRVNDDQKIDVDDQKLNSGRPHDYWIFKSFLSIILLVFSPICLLSDCSAKVIYLRTTTNVTSSAILDLINMHFDSSMTIIY